MATQEETAQALLDAIHRSAGTPNASTATARMVLDLAEAYAWVKQPNQPHGGASR